MSVPNQRPLQTHRNHYLFADYYLDNRLIDQPEWRTLDVSAPLAELTQLWAGFTPHGDNESQTEEEWIRPVLRALDHTFNVQTPLKTPFGVRKPDYLLYPDEASRQLAKAHIGPFDSQAFASTALAVADAKAWERNLDQTGSRQGATISENPSLQMYVYVQHSGLPWGLLTNGRHWRLYHRDTAERLDVYYEVDLPALLDQADPVAFKYFYLFFRREAFIDRPDMPAWLNRVLEQSRAYARGVSDTLKDQVYEALRCLAQGFLDFPANRLDPNPATLKAIYDHSLIVLYRLLFILYAESRGLLPVPDNRLYSRSYSLDALKKRLARELDTGQPAAASMAATWQGLRQLWQVIDEGNPDLDVPAYNGGLFKAKSDSFLDAYQVGDLYLRQAIDLLARAPDPQTKKRIFVDYRDLEIRHLGSIYEGLLEYQVRVADQPLTIRVEKGREIYEPLTLSWEERAAERGRSGPERPAPGVGGEVLPGQVYLTTDKGERKATGSYYTPDTIVKYIVEQTVRPVLDELRLGRGDWPIAPTAAPGGSETLAQAILSINILDPSMGSGHFLVEATDFMARYLVALAVGKPAEAGDESDLAYWRRRVVQNCIYGVDVNPLAVELAKLSLWLTTVARGKPLSFLDHHLRCGNSLIGGRVADLPLETGPPPPKTSTKKRQRAEQQAIAAGQLSMLHDSAFAGSMRAATGFMSQIETLRGDTLAEVQEAEQLYHQVVEQITAQARQLAHVWTARSLGLPELDETLWSGLTRFVLHGGFPLPQYNRILEQANQLAEQRRFFHWELEFPEVFFNASGQFDPAAGFDAIVGNPPYVRQEELSPLKPYFATKFSGVYHGVADLYVYFLGQGVQLLRSEGRLGYITSGTFRKLNFGAPLRKFLASQSTLEKIIEFGEEQVFAEALTYPIILITQNRFPKENDKLLVLNSDAVSNTSLETGSTEQFILPKDDNQWVFMGARLRHILDGWQGSRTLEEILGKPIYRGVTTGFNDAFVINTSVRDHLLQEDRISATIIKPYLRGEDLRPWYQKESDLWLIFTRRGIDLETYPAVKSYLEQFRSKLEPRPQKWEDINPWSGRKPGTYKWYEIQDSVDYYPAFENPRIHSTKVSLFPTFSLSTEIFYTANTSYVIPIPDVVIGHYLLALLNSHVSEYYCRSVFSPKANGYYEVQPNKLGMFPIPDAPDAEREAIGHLAMAITEQARARYQLHRQSRRRILSDLGMSGQNLNQKLTAWWELDFPAFRAEIQKVFKRDIPLVERDEWESWLAERRSQHQQHTAEIIRLETELNRRVYALFDLTPAEIKIIEESTRYRYGEV